MGCFWLIEEKNVIRMRVPFPNINSGLAARPHMYVCIKSGTQKEFLKCQSFRPAHLLKHKPPYKYLIEPPDINRNPFDNKTTIDCDKSFGIENVIVDKSLITSKRKDICDELYKGLKHEIGHNKFIKKHISISPLLSLNTMIRSGV